MDSSGTDKNKSSCSDSEGTASKKRKDKKKDKKKRKKEKKDKKRDRSEEKGAVEKEDEAAQRGGSSDEAEDGELSDRDRHPMVQVTKIDPTEIPDVKNSFLMRTTRPKERNPDESENSDDNGSRGGATGSRQRNVRNFGWAMKSAKSARSGRVIKGRGVFRYRTPSRSRSRSRSVTPPHWRQAQKRTIKYSDFERYEEEKMIRDQEIKRRESERKKRHEEMAKDSKKSFFELQHQTTYVGRVAAAADDDIGGTRSTKEAGTRESTDKAANVDLNALDYEHNDASPEPEGQTAEERREEKKSMRKADAMAHALGVEPHKVSDGRRRNDREDSRDRRNNRRGGDRDMQRRDGRRFNAVADRRNDRYLNERSRPGLRQEDHRRRSRSSRRQSSSAERADRRRRRDERSRSRSRRRSRSASKGTRKGGRKDEKGASSPAAKSNHDVVEEAEKTRQHKEKILKRAEALLMLKDHMRREIANQKEDELELAQLEKIKEQTLAKLNVHDSKKLERKKRGTSSSSSSSDSSTSSDSD